MQDGDETGESGVAFADVVHVEKRGHKTFYVVRMRRDGREHTIEHDPSIKRLHPKCSPENKRVTCPTCGNVVEANDGPSEAATKGEDGVPVSVERFWLLTCPNDGTGMHLVLSGGHLSMDEPRLNEMFPRSTRKQIAKTLSSAERKTFNAMLDGKRFPDWTFLEGVQRRARRDR